jgi:hypothetical protein
MLKKSFFLFFFFVFEMGVYPNNVIKSTVNFDTTNTNPLVFAIVSDRHGGRRPGVFSDAINKLNRLRPAFVMCIGDLTRGGGRDATVFERDFTEIDSLVNTLKMPFFYTAGNHDLSNDIQIDVWKKRYGLPYYHFVYRESLFLVLNSEDPFYGGIGSKEQMNFIQTTLTNNQKVKWTYIFIHRPLWHYKTVFDSAGLHNNALSDRPVNGGNGWQELENLLKKRKYTFFAGHEHIYKCDTINGMMHYTLATTGGGSKLRGVEFGEFDHFVWVRIGDKGAEVSNILLDGITSDCPRRVYFPEKDTNGDGPFKIDISNVFMESGDKNFSTSIGIFNNMTIPMKVSAFYLPKAGLSGNIEPRHFEISVEPGVKNTIPVTGTIDKSVAGIANNFPYQFFLSHADYRGKETISETREYLCVDRPITIQQTIRPVVVDGKLNEWQHLPIVLAMEVLLGDATQFSGNKDCKASIGFTYDRENIYFAEQIIDDVVVDAQSDLPSYLQDGIQFYIDPRPRNERIAKPRYRDSKIDILVSPSSDPSKALFQKELPRGTQCSICRNREGYAVEIAIPLQLLNIHQQGEWKDFGFNLIVNDIDKKDEKKIAFGLRNIEQIWENSKHFAVIAKDYRH